MVSPRKRRTVVGRLRSVTRGKSDSPEDWVSGNAFRFTESPVIAKKEEKRRSNFGRSKVAESKNRRQSILLRRLDTSMNIALASPTNTRKTRRQSMAFTSVSQRKLIENAESSFTTKRSVRKSGVSLPPKKPDLGKTVSAAAKYEDKKETSKPQLQSMVKISPLRFYSSPSKQEESSKPTPVKSPGKRKMDSKETLDEGEPERKRNRVSLPAKREPVRSLRRQEASPKLLRKLSMTGKSSLAVKKPEVKSSFSDKKILRSTVPLQRNRSGSSVTSDSARVIDKVKFAGSKKMTSPNAEKTVAKPTIKGKSISLPDRKLRTKSTEEINSPRITRNASHIGHNVGNPSTGTSDALMSPEIKVKDNSTKQLTRKVKSPEKIPQTLLSEKKGICKKDLNITSPRTQKTVETTKGNSPSEGTSPPVLRKRVSLTVSSVNESVSSAKIELPVSRTKTEGKKSLVYEKKSTTPEVKKSPLSVKRYLRTPEIKISCLRSSDVKSFASANRKSPKTSEVNKSTVNNKSVQGSKVESTPSPKREKSKTPKLRSFHSIKEKTKTTQINAESAMPQKSSLLSAKKTPSKTPAKEESFSGKRLTRSAARKSKRVSLVAASPSKVSASFRKTPASKKTYSADNDIGSSPLLSARAHLELIRIQSPSRSLKRVHNLKAKPYTPKSDSPPSNVLKKNLKSKVSQQMKAVAKVEVHQLMNGEITRPVRISAATTNISPKSSFLESRNRSPIAKITPRKPLTSSALSNSASKLRVLATTPVSSPNLPPTPTSSLKTSESVLLKRTIMSCQSTSKTSCHRVLMPSTPRSSTPIQEDSIFEPLPIDASLQKGDKEINFTDDSINTDVSDMEISVTDSNENECTSSEKPKKWGCLVM
ncbi:hypothetical protein SK128_009968 [Halocaridina rubra]|uniref:Uncharacterized protein n=1 Tax=Halocaridina rubra TaxID=373956 RepID=A0AAN9FX79_HALRR